MKLANLKFKSRSVKYREEVFSDYLSQFEIGSIIPSERELSIILGWTRTTLRELLIYFGHKGILKRQHGKPTYYVKDVYASEEHF